MSRGMSCLQKKMNYDPASFSQNDPRYDLGYS